MCEEILNQTGNLVLFSKSIIVFTIIIISIIIKKEGGGKKMKCYDWVLFPRISYWWVLWFYLYLFTFCFLSFFFFLSWEFRNELIYGFSPLFSFFPHAEVAHT